MMLQTSELGLMRVGRYPFHSLQERFWLGWSLGQRRFGTTKLEINPRLVTYYTASKWNGTHRAQLQPPSGQMRVVSPILILHQLRKQQVRVHQDAIIDRKS